MKIGLDYHSAYGIPQGNQTYMTNLVANLADIDNFNDYILYSPNGIDGPSHLPPNFRVKFVLSPNPIKRLGFELPNLIGNDNVDIFHSIYNSPIWKRCKYVVTIHDILFEHYPELFEAIFILRSKTFVRQSIRRADAIITISNYSREDICNTYGIDKNKIFVTPLGVNKSFRPETSAERINKVLLKYGIEGQYILFVGRLEPRKNIPTLIEAFSLLIKNGFEEYSLVIGGAKDFGYEEIFKAAGSSVGVHKIIFPGTIFEKDLPVLMSGAKIFAYPAFYEGFGLPVLEAMACGTPVVTSNTSSLPEIVGDAGILVNPYEVESLFSGLRTLLTDDNLFNQIRGRGIQRAKLFSWELCAEKTLQVYSNLNS